MSKLPQDVIVHILTYLPVKSLIKFKCVCKSWGSLISDPQFSKLHLKRANEDDNINRRRLLVATMPLYSVDFEAASDGDNDNSVVELPCPNTANNDSFAVGLFLGSCDGLVCILNEVDNMVLWNPSTSESKELPKPSSSLEQCFSTGLGYDSSIDDYKIVIVSSTTANGSDQIMVEVFTLKTNKWRKIQGNHSGITMGGYYEGVFWNGALHWLGRQGTGDARDLDAIVSFDIAEEKFMEVVPLPNHFSTAVLSISGSCLCISGRLHPLETCFEAWIASEFGVKTSWRRLFTIPADKMFFDSYSTEMWLTKKGGVLIDNNGCPGLLILYHPVEDARKILGVQHDSDPFYESAIYIESLVSPC